VGGPKWEPLAHAVRPERGLLGIRSELNLFSNLRPAILYPQLVDASTLKPEVVSGLDLMIVRELTGGIYFGQPRGVHVAENGERVGINTKIYSESEIRRIAHSAFKIAQKRHKTLCSVDKANVLEVTELWRAVMSEVGKDYPDVQLSHMYVDNAAMQLVRAPKQFDVIVTSNMFGDILSDLGPACTGTIGLAPSANLNPERKFPSLFEPVHGSAPDIYGKNIANPTAVIMAGAMMLTHIGEPEAAERVIKAVEKVVNEGIYVTPDLNPNSKAGTIEMGNAIVAAMA
jgi:3-isopropylmalate dehydrogenase